MALMSEVLTLSPSDNRGRFVGQLTADSPHTHGFFAIEVEIDNDRIESARPIFGSMHRGAEKLFESRDYRQILMLANRHEWLGAFAGEVGIAELLEQALGIETTKQVQDLRRFLLDYNICTSHLAFLVGFPWPNPEVGRQFRGWRESMVRHLECFTGSRMHPMITRIGGFAATPQPSWVHETAQLAKDLNAQLSDLDLLNELREFHGLGVFTKSDAIEFAVSGPVARASGHLLDSSASEASPDQSDVASRLHQLVVETQEALSRISRSAGSIAESLDLEFEVILPKVVRLPEGTYSHQVETPLGIACWLLESRGDKYPHRLKLRPASLHTALALARVLVGASLETLPAIVASMPFIAGDVDR